jgi:hypothetical protein
MTTKTIKFYANAYGLRTASIEVFVENNCIFFGEVDTFPLDLNFYRLGHSVKDNEFQEAFQFDIPVDFIGSKAMSISVQNSGVLFGPILANQQILINPKLSSSLKSFDPEVDDPIEWENSSNIEPYVHGPDIWASPTDLDARINVKIDTVAVIPNRKPGETGTWHWFVKPGSTIAFDLLITK